MKTLYNTAHILLRNASLLNFAHDRFQEIFSIKKERESHRFHNAISTLEIRVVAVRFVKSERSCRFKQNCIRDSMTTMTAMRYAAPMCNARNGN